MAEQEEVKERQDLLEMLHDSNKRLIEAKASKKRDAAVHNEQIAGIEDEIEEIMAQLEQVGD